jgi:hypothetical protein
MVAVRLQRLELKPAGHAVQENWATSRVASRVNDLQQCGARGLLPQVRCIVSTFAKSSSVAA